MFKWCLGWFVKMGLLVVAYVAILYGVTMFSSEWAASETMAILEKYAQGDWEALGKSVSKLFPYLADFLDTICPFLKLVGSSTISSPLVIVYDIVNALMMAAFFKVFELIYQGIIQTISDRLLGVTNRLADLWASVVGAYISLVLVDIANIHLHSFFSNIYEAFPVQLLPHVTVGTVAVVGIVVSVLLAIVGFIWLVGRKNVNLMTALGKSFLDILLGVLVTAMIYLLAGSALSLKVGGPMPDGLSIIIMIACVLGITVLSSILFKNSILKVLK